MESAAAWSVAGSAKKHQEATAREANKTGEKVFK
jgi:hypothetical protein